MRKIRLFIAASFDGQIARADDSLDWLPMPEEGGEDFGYAAFMESVDAVLTGRRTYEVVRDLGPWPYEGRKCYVFSSQTPEIYSPDTEIVREAPETFCAALKRQPGKDIFLVGGGQLIQPLHDAGLIDEYIVGIIPVLLGAGLPLFHGLTRERKLILRDCKTGAGGVVMLYYVPADAAT